MGRPAKPAAMGRAVQVNMDTEKRKELLHELEMRHQIGAGQSDLLVKDEDVRRLKLRILVLRDENTTLRDQIAQNTDNNIKLAEKCSGLNSQLEAKIELARSQEKQLRKQEREFSSLKAELQSMNNLSQDSTNILAEKLALSRELAVLKPELEHLKSQLAHQQVTLVEKLALERQVNTLEVELSNEKKATKRAMLKRESNDQVEDDLRKKVRETEKQLTAERAQRERLEDQLAQEKKTHQLALQDQDSTREHESDLRRKLQDAQRQLREEKEEKERIEEELQAEKRIAKKAQQKQASTSAEDHDELHAKLQEIENELAAERKATEHVRMEAQNALAEAESRNDSLEKRLEKMKTKLRETQDQLKHCQADLRKAQKTQTSVPEEVAKMTAGRQAFRKRKANEIAVDDIANITIATPSADDRPHRAAKKRSIEPALVGEKSTFSITPFLNRTKNLIEDTPNTDEEMDDTISGPPDATTRVIEVITTTVPIGTSDDNTTSSITTLGIPSEPSETISLEADQPQPEAQPKKARGRPKKVLGDATSARKNAQPVAKTALKKKVPKLSNTLEKVSEENEPAANQENDKTQADKFNFTVPQDDSTVSANTSKGEEPKKKKRKVLGSTKTLFDDEEREVPPPHKAGKTTLGGGKAVSKAAPLGCTRNAFGAAKRTFSPLKKDRRGVGASFLA